jgi:hypothetical protein
MDRISSLQGTLPSGVEAALPSSSTYCTLINITPNVTEAVLDAVIHDILQKNVRTALDIMLLREGHHLSLS